MANELNLTVKTMGELVAINSLVSLLLARDAKRSGVQLDALHSALIQTYSEKIKGLARQNPLFAALPHEELEAAITAAFDDLFSLAEILRRIMP